MDSEVITVRTGSRPVVRDITSAAADFVANRGDGLLHVFVPHATAGVAILETGAGSEQDLLGTLDTLLPADGRWRHRHGSPGHGREQSPMRPSGGQSVPHATVAAPGRCGPRRWPGQCESAFPPATGSGGP